MPHDINLIATIAAAFGLACILGIVAARLKLPPIVGYLLAGIAIGPATPGFVADIGLAAQLAEIGVMLLMFGVGLHFSLDDLMSVKRIAIPGAIVQIGVATALGGALATAWGWHWPSALIFGLCLSVASTVVLLKALEARGVLESVNGQIAVGWLIVEDLVMVLVLVLMPVLAQFLAGGTDAVGIAARAGLTLAKVTAFVVLMLVVGKRVLPALLWVVAKTGSRELFTLAVIAVAIGVAFGAAKLFDVSFALGAFFAGMMLRNSEYAHRAAEESLPLRDAFAVLFFVSVGMLFDPAVLVAEPAKLAWVLGIVLIGKTLAAVSLALLLRYPLNTALTVGASLAQIGEFSFIVAALGVALGLLPIQGQSLVLAAALLSIALNPLMFKVIDPVCRMVAARSPRAARFDSNDDPLSQLPESVGSDRVTHHVVLVGHGRVGRRVSAALSQHAIEHVVVDLKREQIESLRNRGQPAVLGDAGAAETLIQAHIVRAALLIIAKPDSIDVLKMADVARQLNPDIKILVRSHDDEEARLLQESGLGQVFVGEEALARAMTDAALAQMQGLGAKV